jgi:amidophosphoribosyltransferase
MSSAGHDDRPHEECGLFGVFGNPEAATLTYLGLYALQHRGQEGAGIVSFEKGQMIAHRGVGLVADVFKPHRLAVLKGTHAIGHVRYSTFGTSVLKNVQPLVVDHVHGSMALAHNGNLVNAHVLRRRLEEEGAIFQSTTDSAVVVHLIARSKKATFAERVVDALKQVEGAYSILATDGHTIVAVRDPHGYRPLWLGRLGDAHIFASESCALDIIDAQWVRELAPGEMMIASDFGIKSSFPFEQATVQKCIFEFVYLARPDSYIFGQSVDAVRKRLGHNLAKIAPVDADIVMSVPDSSNAAALGYSHESGIPFEMGFIRNHYVGRTFIEPEGRIRDFGVKIKLNPARNVIEGKEIVLIDDSIVRGTTSRKIVKMLRRYGAKKIHFRVSSPPIINCCYYGIDTAVKKDLISANYSVDEIKDFIEADSLVFQSIEGLVDATGSPASEFCLACFNDQYGTRKPCDFESAPATLRHRDTSTGEYERLPVME